MSQLPEEAAGLLSAAPADFVDERRRIARALRDAGRREDAEKVAALRKPTAVVLAVNRAARERPDVTEDAVAAAGRVRETQLGGAPDDYRRALIELERALAELATLASEHLVQDGRASEAMRRRVVELLRAAVTNEATKEALAAGTLTEELDAAGFSSFDGMSPPARSRRSRARTGKPRRNDLHDARVAKLKEKLTGARDALRAAERDVVAATRQRDRAAQAVASLESELARLAAE